VLLRDDKSFPYILMTGDHAAPRADQASRRAPPQGRLFRALRHRPAVKRTITALQRAFLLRTCSDSYFAKAARGPV
jgi:excinuclease ABC subunit C